LRREAESIRHPIGFGSERIQPLSASLTVTGLPVTVSASMTVIRCSHADCEKLAEPHGEMPR
jgi:hypothetical protein